MNYERLHEIMIYVHFEYLKKVFRLHCCVVCMRCTVMLMNLVELLLVCFHSIARFCIVAKLMIPDTHILYSFHVTAAWGGCAST